MTGKNDSRGKNGFIAALDERVGFSSVSYPIPKYANSLLYMLGGITLFCFLILIATGVFLSQYYNPDPTKAHDSVVYIMTKVPFGAYIRSVHHWSANFAMALLIFHVLRVFITGSYKRPREATWLTGVVLLIITVAFLFSGTVLKWDQESVEALGHNEAVGSTIGILGSIFTNNFSQSNTLLTRLYNAHVSILLILFGTLLMVHFYLIKRHGISPKAVYDAVSVKTKGLGSSKFSSHMQKLAGFGLITYAVIGVFALIFPAPIGYPGVSGPEVTKPPWFFLPLYAVENFFGIQALIWAPLLLIALLVIIPFIDRSKWVSPLRRKLVVGFGLLFFLILLILGLYAYFAPAQKHIMKEGMKSSQSILGFNLIPSAYAHGGAEESSNTMVMSDTEAMPGSMTLELDNSLPTKTAIIFSILFCFHIGLILIREGHAHE